MERIFKTVSLSLLCSAHFGAAKSIDKSCVQHPRLVKRAVPCSDPVVPERIHRHADSGMDVCGIVAYGLLGDFELFDVVLLPSSLCQADLEPGVLTHDQVKTIIPNDDELVALHLQGAHLVETLEIGVEEHHFQHTMEDQVRAAGVQYDVHLKKPFGKRVANVEILNHGCDWEPIQHDKIYIILTTQQNARKRNSPLLRYHFLTPIRHSVVDAFWSYSRETCEVADPYRPLEAPDPLSCPSPYARGVNITTSSSF